MDLLLLKILAIYKYSFGYIQDKIEDSRGGFFYEQDSLFFQPESIDNFGGLREKFVLSYHCNNLNLRPCATFIFCHLPSRLAIDRKKVGSNEKKGLRWPKFSKGYFLLMSY